MEYHLRFETKALQEHELIVAMHDPEAVRPDVSADGRHAMLSTDNKAYFERCRAALEAAGCPYTTPAQANRAAVWTTKPE